MALASPSNLLSLHNAGGKTTSALPFRFAMRYDYNPKVTAIPDLTLFDGLSPDDPGPKALPTLAECAVHLEMLEAFQTLRQEVIHSKKLDKAFGIEPKKTTVYRKVWNGARRRKDRTYTIDKHVLKDPDFASKRKNKWTYFLQISAVRFHTWIQVVNRCLKDHDANGAPIPRYLLLPPLDILIIWHAYLLNCDDFKAYCAVQNLHHVQNIAFPWAAIHNAIDRETWSYTVPSEQADWLRENGDLDASLIDALSETTTSPKNPAWSLLKEFGSMTKKPWTEGLHDPLVQIILKARATRGSNEALVNNVERQVVFVDKMHGHRWIRSPAVHGTLRRAVDRYDKFLHLFRLYPNTFLVPTLDVDLVWHTHQCSAENYRAFVTERVGKFINHDDKIGRGTLDNGFTSAEEWYRLTYGEQYQVCLCWSCEAILSAVEKLDDDVLAAEDATASLRDLSVRIEREVNYYREVETARRLGKNLPVGWNHHKAA
ncbi:hypothetical protein ASPCAL05990 [Aspergillus calidoustus]|uniref:Uncharacterized protein n=1 Tax=Aspergillus calidoustus TaxID=454130 RepID=A0A0U5FYW6_ASPCI|nr:hypothetical protein ASPCAL05990 [Aspergillus calidoustus]